MSRLNRLNETVRRSDALATRLDDLKDLIELTQAEDDESLIGEVAAESREIARDVRDLDFEVLLSGDYAENDAVLSIHAGAGGTESQDWAQMLMRMYLRWSENRRYSTSIISMSEGEEAGIKSVDIEISGRFAYGYLRAERGVHRLVRLSPFDSAKRRHTSFALVEVMPVTDEDAEIEINPDDLRVDTYRSTGAGGQHVNKTESAVRLTHIPTGIVVTCQNQRSQIQNRELAMRVLRSRLLEKQLEERQAAQARIKGVHVEAGWGNQIRSYVLHPYNMVKDLRTGTETSNTAGVLNGEVDEFIESYLRSGPDVIYRPADDASE
jgi:peptide chain release factor 2